MHDNAPILDASSRSSDLASGSNSGAAPLDRRSALAALGGLGAAAAASVAFAQPKVNPIPDPRGPVDPRTKPEILPSRPAGQPGSTINFGFDAQRGEYVLPPLPYDKAALEPHIDAQTMEIHHGKHHAAYVSGLNKALLALKAIREGAGDAGLIKHWSREVSFHGAGHVNHALFWHMMAPAGNGGGGQPSGDLAQAINRDFGSFEAFTAHFKAAANAVEGGGWAWLVHEPVADRLLIIQMEKQQDMYLTGAHPLLGVDVWEHAYYIKYQNRRSDYVNAFMNVINWGFVQRLFASAIEHRP
ncbi:MAG: superoxide dismutase [Planctomycetota bacterium]|nr:superoxide dismutase [Planctomycetota bacterium]